MFTRGAKEHQLRVDLAEAAFAQARKEQDTVATVMDGDLLRAWKRGELIPLERRTIMNKMLDRVVLYPSKRRGKKTRSDIGERTQIVLKGNALLLPAEEREPATTT